MAMSVTYVTFDGVMLLEDRGGVQTTYIPDTLASLMQCLGILENKIFEAQYGPYGELRTQNSIQPFKPVRRGVPDPRRSLRSTSC